MVTWRPVSGDILRLDPALASVGDIEEFFAERRIPARGIVAGEDGYRIELAVTGRRRRIAVLDEEGHAVPGPTLGEFVEEMDGSLRKLQIDLGGIIAWGDIDLGEVDVEGDDVDDSSLQSVDRELYDDVGDDLPDFKGPMLIGYRPGGNAWAGCGQQAFSCGIPYG